MRNIPNGVISRTARLRLPGCCLKKLLISTFYVGRAVNPAHQNPDLPINFSIKMRLVDELSDALKQMGKRIKVSYF